MDIYICYWDSLDKQVKARYWCSDYRGHATNVDGATSLNKSIASLTASRIFHISKNRPNVNLKFYEEIVSERTAGELLSSILGAVISMLRMAVSKQVQRVQIGI